MPLHSLDPDLLEDRFGQKRTLLLVTLAAFLLLNLTAYSFPLEGIFSGDPNHPALTSYARYRDSFAPLARDPFNAVTPLGPQFRLRLFAPLLAWLFHIPNPYSALIIVLGTLPAIFALATVLRRHLPPQPAALATLGLTLTTPFFISNCWMGYPDALALAFVFACMLTRSPWALAPLMFLAMLNDERALTSMGLILCWHFYLDIRTAPPSASPQTSPALTPYRAAARHSYALVFAALVAFALWALYARAMLSHLHMTWIEFFAPAMTKIAFAIPRIPYHLSIAYRAVWLFPLVAFVLMIRSRPHRGLAIAALLFTVPIFQSAIVVGDTNRVICWTFPFVILSILYLHDHRPTWLLPMLLQTLAIDLLSPVLLGFFTIPHHIHPLPYVLLERALGVKYNP